MNIKPKYKVFLLWLVMVSSALPLQAKESPQDIRVAVASNFATTMNLLAQAFSKKTGHTVHVARASTGKHYAQILQGAPFDIFFSADAERVEKLVESGDRTKNASFVYAIGRLVLWSRYSELIRGNPPSLSALNFRYLAIADPELAPYGTAARDVLVNMGLWDQLDSSIVRGENIGQAFQFVYTGNAELGFVAASQLNQIAISGSGWDVPQYLHKPIVQKGLVLSDSNIAHEFVEFVTSSEGRAMIAADGYLLPDEQ